MTNQDQDTTSTEKSEGRCAFTRLGQRGVAFDGSCGRPSWSLVHRGANYGTMSGHAFVAPIEQTAHEHQWVVTAQCSVCAAPFVRPANAKVGDMIAAVKVVEGGRREPRMVLDDND